MVRITMPPGANTMVGDLLLTPIPDIDGGFTGCIPFTETQVQLTFSRAGYLWILRPAVFGNSTPHGPVPYVKGDSVTLTPVLASPPTATGGAFWFENVGEPNPGRAFLVELHVKSSCP